MPIKVRCKECDTTFSVKDEAEGKRVRCKGCGAPVRVSRARKKKKRSASSDSEDFLANFDINKIEDKESKICPRCGHDVDEEDIECENCGIDLSTGRMREATRKKRSRRGPAIEEFYGKSWGDAYKFLGNHKGLAIKTFLYTLISTSLFFGAIFMMLWCHRTPPRGFWAFIAFVSIMAVPGWIWFLQTEVVRFALQKKDKLKRINFDFFLCSALGIKFILWFILFSLPAQAIFGSIGAYFILNDSILVGAILIAVGFIPTFLMFPLAMPHMTMSDSTPGWMINKMGKVFLDLAKPAFFWCVVFLITNLPAIGCLAAIGVVYGSELEQFFSDVRLNSAIAADEQAKEYAEENKIKDFEPGDLVGEPPVELEPNVLIVPYVIWVFFCVLYAPAVVYNARVNGLMALHCKPDLQLVTKVEETKYVSKEERKKNGDGTSAVQLAVIGVLGGIGVWLFNFVITIAFTAVALALGFPLIIFLIGLGIILFTPPLIAFVCWIISLVEIAKRDGALHCVIGFFFSPYAYGKGWTYVGKSKSMGKVMLLWTLMISFYFYALLLNLFLEIAIPGSERPEDKQPATAQPAEADPAEAAADPADAAAGGDPAAP